MALLDQEHSLRRWLADPAGSPDSKSELVNSLLETKVSPATLLWSATSSGRSGPGRATWSTRSNRPLYWRRSLSTPAPANSRASRTSCSGWPDRRGLAELRAALTTDGASIEHKRTLVENLLSGKVSTATLTLVTEAVTRPRGRTLEQGLEHFSQLVAERAKHYIAVVRARGSAERSTAVSTAGRAHPNLRAGHPPEHRDHAGDRGWTLHPRGRRGHAKAPSRGVSPSSATPGRLTRRRTNARRTAPHLRRQREQGHT